jgi:hypothetical protein
MASFSLLGGGSVRFLGASFDVPISIGSATLTRLAARSVGLLGVLICVRSRSISLPSSIFGIGLLCDIGYLMPVLTMLLSLIIVTSVFSSSMLCRIKKVREEKYFRIEGLKEKSFRLGMVLLYLLS